MDLVSNTDNYTEATTNVGSSDLPSATAQPMVGFDHTPTTSQLASLDTHGVSPPIPVHVSTSIPVIPSQLGSASGNSAPGTPRTHMSPPTTQDPMSILQGVQNVYMHQPTITMTNNNIQQSNTDGNSGQETRTRGVTPLEVTRTDSVGYEKAMTTKATLHRDGKVVIKTSTSCHDLFHGLRGRVLIVLRDRDGAAIGATDKMRCTTRGGLLDILTPSFGDDWFFLEFPQDVAKLAANLDIWQADDGSVGDDTLSRILERAQGSIAIARR